MRKIFAVGAAAGVLIALAGFGPAYAGDGGHGHGHGSGDNGPAELTVFHGIPGITVETAGCERQ